MSRIKDELKFFLIAINVAAGICVAASYVYAWTDNTLTTSTPIRAIHIQEIRNTVAAKRTQCGISSYSWTDPSLSAGVTRTRKIHIDQLRTAIQDIYNKAPARPLGFAWTDSNIIAGTTLIRTAHITQLRTAITNASCCGDGTLNSPYEACDDGNRLSGDGCSSVCNIEVSPPCPNTVCDIAGGECSTCPADCAGNPGCLSDPCSDGTCNTAEDCVCPDGHGDCTVAQCTVDPCSDGTCNTVVDCACSNGHGDCTVAQCTVDPCSDGTCNTVVDCACANGHGDCTIAQCAPPCGNETCGSGENCSNCPADCGACPAICGNGVQEGSEQCDDGNTNDCDACGNNCQWQYCGDGIKKCSEFCDDGNTDNCDACTNSCQAGNTCGDGVKRCGEQCDNGVNNGVPCVPSGNGANCTYCTVSCISTVVQNGGWCPWGGWSDWIDEGCGFALPCGIPLGERRYRERECNCPAPSNGGATCSGASIETETNCYSPPPTCS